MIGGYSRTACGCNLQLQKMFRKACSHDYLESLYTVAVKSQILSIATGDQPSSLKYHLLLPVTCRHTHMLRYSCLAFGTILLQCSLSIVTSLGMIILDHDTRPEQSQICHT